MLLVTGANGFIGSHLTEHLVGLGHPVRCLARKTSNLKYLDGLPVDLAYGDLTTADAWPPSRWRKLLDGVRAVFHLAGATTAVDERGFRRGNVLTTRHLLDGCLRHAPRLERLVTVSSLAAAGPARNGQPVDEQTPPAPLSAYGRSKLAAEREVAAAGDRLPVTILRPPPVYGPRDVEVFGFFRAVRYGIRPRVGRRGGQVSLIHCRDLISAMVLAWQHPKAAGQTFFVANAAPTDWQRFGRLVAEMLGVRTVAVCIPKPVVFGLGHLNQWASRLLGRPALLSADKAAEMVQPNWTCDTRKVQRLLGFRTEVDLPDGLRATLDWYRQEGWL